MFDVGVRKVLSAGDALAVVVFACPCAVKAVLTAEGTYELRDPVALCRAHRVDERKHATSYWRLGDRPL